MAATYLTEDGLQKLRSELERLKSVERPAITRAIAEARDKGDLSENAEYHAAKEAQGMLEIKITQMENMLVNVKVIDETRVNTGQVQILNRVKIKNLNTQSVVEYTLVTENEADIKQGRLAVTTPIAKALLGKKVGDIAEAQAPSGTIKFEVLEIGV